MGSNYIATDATITPSIRCLHDSAIGFSADFSKNGDVDGWEYFDGIHTYGCWGGFLFGTLDGQYSYGTVGRYEIFRPVNATTHYFIRVIMKYNPWPRDDRGNHPLPTQAKMRWRTLQDTLYDEKKEIYFDIVPDNKWHTYIVNVGVKQWWQGDVNDLRFWPAADNAYDGDEFFIRGIEIFSTESHECRNTACERFDDYVYPCPWVGLRATCESDRHEDNKLFNIENLTEFIININGYGNEVVKVKEVLNGTGREVANELAKGIARNNMGGYAEVQVEFTTDNTFKIYTGTIHEDSTVEVIDNELSRYLKFFNILGGETTTKTAGETPVNGYSPLSSFKIKTSQAFGLLDNSKTTAITFNPFQYSVEGGRRDWLSSSTGIMASAIGNNDGDVSGQPIRKYFLIGNAGTTIIDYNHPFNASGRIEKIWVQCTFDSANYGKSTHETARLDEDGNIPAGTRKGDELYGGKLLIVRPKRSGQMEVIYEFDLNDRDPSRGLYDAMYSLTQEGIDLDVDVFVNKGDLIAVYNANMYVGKSVSGHEIDAQFHQILGKPEVGEIFDPGRLYGDGSAGLLVYAHGYAPQKRLYLDIDLGSRYNVEKVEVKGQALNSILEYNIARCLDINWEVELFGHYHWTFHKRIDMPGEFWYQRYNVHFGLDNLSDGIYNVPDGLACDSYTLTTDLSSKNYNYDAGPGVVPVNPRYFWVNGDEEWLAVWMHAGTPRVQQAVFEFDEDPVAIFLHFPHEKEKIIYKSKIYFKEKFNFRNIAMSTYGGFYYTLGDADDFHYDLVPEYTKIVLDSVEFYEGSPTYDMIADYLFNNPCVGEMLYSPTSEVIYEWDPIYSDVIEDYSGRYGAQESGYFTYQTFQVDNATEWQTARRVDWQILEHQWEPITCKGWRIYTDFHKSTKITEMELYGVAEDLGSSLAGSVVMTYSDYKDIWWPTESVQHSEELVEIYIGDSPQHFTLEIIPITETRYDDAVIYVRTEDLHAGEKGCEYIYYAEKSKIGEVNEGQLIEVKNNYGAPYDLQLDINTGKLVEEGLLFYSDLGNLENIKNPAVGPDASYYKLDSYPLVNQDYNCAINCHTFGLRNLIDGNIAHFTYNDMLNWDEWGLLGHGNSINFYNLPTSSRTTVYVPQLSRNRFWKFGLSDPDLSMNIREMRVYDVDNNRLDPEFYHDLNKTFEDAPVSERAPHLENISVVGSYYTLAGDQYITMDLGEQISLGRIELFHDGINNYINFDRVVIPYSGIDKYTKMCLRSWYNRTTGEKYLKDVSYYEHDVVLHGSAHIDIGDGSYGDSGNVSIPVDIGCLTDLADWTEDVNTGWPVNYTTLSGGSWATAVSASGTVTSGTCEYPGYIEFGMLCHNYGNDRIYYDLREDPGYEAYRMFGQLPFELTFAIEIDAWEPGGRDPTIYDDSTINYPPDLTVGVTNGRRRPGGQQLFQGVQMYFDPKQGRFGLGVRNIDPFTIGYYTPSSTGWTHTYTSGLNVGQKYYCKLTGYGSETGDNLHRDTDVLLYRAEVWTDAIDGSNRIVNITRSTSYYWEAMEVSVGGGGWNVGGSNYSYSTYGPGAIWGTVYDLKLNVNHEVKHYPWREEEVSDGEKCSIRIPDGNNNYVQVKNSRDLDVRARYHTHDFWVKFRTLPARGERQAIMEQYNYDNPAGANRGWRLALYCATDGSYYRWEWWVNRGSAYGYQWTLEEYNGQTGYSRYVNHFNIVKDKWYFMVFSTGKQYSGGGFFRIAFLDIDGRALYDSSYPGNPSNMYDMPGGADIILGKDFDGWVCEPRVSVSDNDLGTNHGGHRYATGSQSPIGAVLSYNQKWESPIKTYHRMYPFTFYVSDDNQYYGFHSNVDAQFPVANSTYLPYLYYFPDNEFAEHYNTYFAIDLGHRYDIDIVRRYGASNDHFLDKDANVIYSSIDTDNPYTAFMSEPSYDAEDSFYGYGGELLNEDRWYLGSAAVGNEKKYLSMHNGRLEHLVDSDIPSCGFYSNFGFRGDFSVEVKIGRVSAPNIYNWYSTFRMWMSNEVRSSYSDTDSSNTFVQAQMAYVSTAPNPYYIARAYFRDGGTNYSTDTALNDDDVGLRIKREGYHFYVEYYDQGAWHELDDRPIVDGKGKDITRLQFWLSCDTLYPTTKIYWKDFKINYADRVVERGTYGDARWMAIEMLNGDNVSRYLKKLGIYPDITRFNSPDNFNYNSLGWADLGPSVTGYSTGNNAALGAPISASSDIGVHIAQNANNGVIDNERSHAWLSDNSTEQWLLIDLESEKDIYRVKLYHGWSTNDNQFMAQDYRIESSLDNESFTTRWTVTNNGSFTRTHDLATPFAARYIRLYITSYKADNEFYIKELDGITYYRWEGACLREIEVYEYYGYDLVNSEEWPIIAINLRDQFYVDGWAMQGVDAESTLLDWSEDPSNFAWSDSALQDPKKVTFTEFGTLPTDNYVQWVVVKRDTASWYNIDPADTLPQHQGNGIDYLKHLVIKSTTKENPINYPWWWSSVLSTISRDYSMAVTMCTSSLKIDYPGGTALDSVQFIEGSNWGEDSLISWRDGLTFRWYIEDIDKLDTSEGYVFFGGLDGTNSPQPVEYRWHLNTLSGLEALESGWNFPFFRLKEADEVIYNENADQFSIIRPEIPEYTQLQTWGFKFKGTGEAFSMNIDGGVIGRNHFSDQSKFGPGLYLAGSDYLEMPLGETDLKAGTIEFWLRPDYDFYGLDVFRRFKNRSLFHFGNVANDVFGFMIGSEGLDLYYGNLVNDTRAMLVKGIISGVIDGLYHIAVAFSANGQNIDSDGSSIKLYINNSLVATNYDTWSYTDEKLFKFTLGGKAPLVFIEHSSSLKTTSVDGVISNLRMYNYCKSDFTDSMNNTFAEYSGDLLLPAKMIEISQDNVTYYKIGDRELPFFYEKVPAGDSVEVYVRSIIPDGLTGKEDRTAGIITSWDIGV